MYAKCRLLDNANKVFQQMELKDVVSWNPTVTSHSHIGRYQDALGLFENIWEEKIELDVLTWSVVISNYVMLKVIRFTIMPSKRFWTSKTTIVEMNKWLSFCLLMVFVFFFEYSCKKRLVRNIVVEARVGLDFLQQIRCMFPWYNNLNIMYCRIYLLAWKNRRK